MDTALATLPLWNAEALAERPDSAVFVTGGMGSAMAAEEYFPQYICLTGALSADWTVLKGRVVHLWPDAGVSGEERMRKLADALQPIAAKISLHRQDDQQAGWTLEHARDEGWTKDQLMDYIRRDEGGHVSLLKAGKAVAKKKDKPPIEAQAIAPAQDLGLQHDHVGRPHPTEANAMRVFIKHEKYIDRLWFDEFSRRIMLDKERFDIDIHGVQALVWMQEALDFQRISLTAVERAASLVAHSKAHHPVKAYLDPLQWDGTDRLSGFMANVYGAQRSEYCEAVGRNWMISAVARIYKPGCKADCMMVLEGNQGTLKSSSLAILGGEWFAESHDKPTGNSRKDFLDNIVQGHWIIEVPEMHSIAGAINGIEQIKAVISSQTDNYRTAYGRGQKEYPRQCIFAGTTNLTEWNSDPTGGRRFWPIECGKIDLKYLKTHRDQLWAEAVSRYKGGESWWNVPESEALEQQELRRHIDVWESVVEQYITHIPTHHEDRTVSWMRRNSPLPMLQVQKILSDALNKPAAAWTTADYRRIASILRAMGYARQRTLIDGARAWVYRLMTAPPETREIIDETDDDSDVPY